MENRFMRFSVKYRSEYGVAEGRGNTGHHWLRSIYLAHDAASGVRTETSVSDWFEGVTKVTRIQAYKKYTN